MTEYAFPLRTHHAFAERLSDIPPGAPARRWVLRDDNQQHYHGRLKLSEDPVTIELWWKADSRGQEQVVGLYRLHLAALLAAGYIRPESDDARNSDVRLRFYRGDRGVVFIQVRQGAPALPIGTVDRSLG